jgi:hypothetical protein
LLLPLLCVTGKGYEDGDPSNDSPKGPLGGLLSYLRSEVKECTQSKFIDRYYRLMLQN